MVCRKEVRRAAEAVFPLSVRFADLIDRLLDLFIVRESFAHADKVHVNGAFIDAVARMLIAGDHEEFFFLDEFLDQFVERSHAHKCHAAGFLDLNSGGAKLFNSLIDDFAFEFILDVRVLNRFPERGFSVERGDHFVGHFRLGTEGSEV